MKVPPRILARQQEITADFLKLLDQHLDDVLAGRVLDMLEIRDFADLMHIHPTHLSNTIKLTTGKSPCHFFEFKIMDVAREQLRENKLSIGAIAMQLTYDPSNFVKFFKRFEGSTPKQYRERMLKEKYTQSADISALKTEVLTIKTEAVTIN